MPDDAPPQPPPAPRPRRPTPPPTRAVPAQLPDAPRATPAPHAVMSNTQVLVRGAVDVVSLACATTLAIAFRDPTIAVLAMTGIFGLVGVRVYDARAASHGNGPPALPPGSGAR